MIFEVPTSFCLVDDHLEHLWVLLLGLIDKLLEQVRWLRLLPFRTFPQVHPGGHSHREGGDLLIEHLSHVSPFVLGGYFLFAGEL
jgi:hypothetical protein